MANNPRRGPGAPVGNRNAWKHGRRSARAILARRLAWARLKALCHIGLGLGLFPPDQRPQNRPLRLDQLTLLATHDPDLFAMVLRHAPRAVVGGALVERLKAHTVGPPGVQADGGA